MGVLMFCRERLRDVLQRDDILCWVALRGVLTGERNSFFFLVYLIRL
jgi:hypothetical protein